MKQKEHELNNNQIASKGKIFLGAILDFCLQMLILMFIYGLVASPILSATGFFDGYQNKKQEFFNYIEKTQLFTFDEDGQPINSNIEASNYVKKMVKTNYYFEGKEFKELINGQPEIKTLTEKDTLGYKADGVFQNDNVAYYFFNYRNSSECDLPSSIKEDFGEYKTDVNYFYKKLFNLEEASNRLYFNEEVFNACDITEYVSSEPLLDSKYADLLYDYLFLNKASEEGQEVFEKFSRMYHNAVNLCFAELDEHSETYKTTYGAILKEENRIYSSQVVAIILSYCVSFSIYFILIPVFLKEGRTVGMKFSRLTYSTVDDKYPPIKNIVIKDTILFLTQAVSMIFPVLFLGSNAMMFAKIGSGFRFVYLLVFFAIITLTSVIMSAWSKKHQFLCEYTSLLVQKDTDSLKVSEENAVID